MPPFEPDRMPGWPVPGWEQLDIDEYDQIWGRFNDRFHLRPGTRTSDWPAIVEPVPSLTWDLAISRHDLEERVQSSVARFAVDRGEVNRLVMSALQDCLRADDWMYVLDWQHPAYRYWPHRFADFEVGDIWPVDAVPDGDYYSFVSRDLCFGTFGHPWETTLCVWGSDLLKAVAARNDGVLTHLYRRDGRPVDPARPHQAARMSR